MTVPLFYFLLLAVLVLVGCLVRAAIEVLGDPKTWEEFNKPAPKKPTPVKPPVMFHPRRPL